ncbi:MAG TPA: hypothetical protein VH186_12625, partial [Chloroflexia bacterium]|nr:hypothetical protein [Chloroflexia bacterium]
MTTKSLEITTHKTNRINEFFRQLTKQIWRYRVVYLLLLPGLIYFAVFKYGPLYYAQIAFKDFKPILGVEGSPWIGLQNF